MDAVAALTIALALTFCASNGFHDASDAVATPVATRALPPKAALALAAFMNTLGAFLGTGIAHTITTQIVSVPTGTAGLRLIVGALVGALAVNVITWMLGMPSSSTHALVGGLVGGAWATASPVSWGGVALWVGLPLVLSPALGSALAYALTRLLGRVAAGRDYRVTSRRMRYAQTLSSAAVALGHGIQDAQKSMAVVMLVLMAAGWSASPAVPLWVVAACAGAIGLGTLGGGWRISRTLARRIVRLNPTRGFVAEAVSAICLHVAAAARIPVSTTQVLSSALVGSGLAGGLRAVNWATVARVSFTWLAVPAAAGFLAAAAAWALG